MSSETTTVVGTNGKRKHSKVDSEMDPKQVADNFYLSILQ
jgi:hypothetical protein